YLAAGVGPNQVGAAAERDPETGELFFLVLDLDGIAAHVLDGERQQAWRLRRMDPQPGELLLAPPAPLVACRQLDDVAPVRSGGDYPIGSGLVENLGDVAGPAQHRLFVPPGKRSRLPAPGRVMGGLGIQQSVLFRETQGQGHGFLAADRAAYQNASA